ncbi:MAG: sel1 repeat family protein [Paludibacteraceae bacterium]|nr:sel1 repeat family protein [Paludibacteraceae bacterium]
MENILTHICQFDICTKNREHYFFNKKEGKWETCVGVGFPHEKIEANYDYYVYDQNEGWNIYYAFVEFDNLELDYMEYVIDKPYERVLIPMPAAIKEEVLSCVMEMKSLEISEEDEIFSTILNAIIENGYVSKPNSDEAELNATNDIEQCYQKGLAFWNGEGCPENKERAMPWLKKAADAGHTDAEYMMAYAYSLGQGVEVIDYTKAVTWAARATKKGCAYAETLMLHLQSCGYEPDEDCLN